jgi:hypothetical protein
MGSRRTTNVAGVAEKDGEANRQLYCPNNFAPIERELPSELIAHQPTHSAAAEEL